MKFRITRALVREVISILVETVTELHKSQRWENLPEEHPSQNYFSHEAFMDKWIDGSHY